MKALSALKFPQIKLSSVLGDGDSVRQRVVEKYTPKLKGQIDDNMVSLGLDNLDNILSRYFDSRNETLEQKRVELKLKVR